MNSTTTRAIRIFVQQVATDYYHNLRWRWRVIYLISHRLGRTARPFRTIPHLLRICSPPHVRCVALRCGELRGARPVPMEARRSSRQEAAAASLTHGEDVGLDVATAPLCD